MASELDYIREFRLWAKMLKNKEDIKKMEEFTGTLYNLRQAFSALNPEMKMFNENINKSNEFLGRIAKIQESMEAQTRSANRFTVVVVALAVIQVILAALPYVIKQ